jgi:protein gp37
VTLHPDKLDEPKRWKTGRRIFVNSMSDLFHEDVPLGFLKQVFDVMVSCPQHQFLILAKRSERLREFAHCLPWPKNVWMGVSVEDSRVLSRVDDLRTTPAQVKFLSCEPLIGPLTGINLEGIDWVIVGGESGPGARSMDPYWVLDVRDMCQAAGVPFFFKQWGGTRKHLTGRELEGRTYDEMPVS